MDTLFSNVTCVTMNEAMDVLFSAFVGVEDGKIAYIGKKPPAQPPKTILDGTGMVLMPGLINCSAQLYGSLFRLYADGWTQEQRQWLAGREEKLDGRAVKAASLLTLSQCLRFGITSVSDLSYFTDDVAQTVAQSGIKANLARGAVLLEPEEEEFDVEADPGYRELVRLHKAWHGHDGRIRVDAGVASVMSSNCHLWEALGGYCKEAGLGMQLNLCREPEERDQCLDRYGLTPTEILDCHGGFWAPAAVTGFGVPAPEELALLKKRRASLVACPIGDRNLGLPCADVLTLAKSGVNVALGTGSPAAGTGDLFAVMRGAVAGARAAGGNLPAPAALMMATVCGARAQGREAECGMVKVGMDADLILVDFTAPHLMPCHNVMTQLVHGASGSDVALTMVRGKILYQSGQFKTIDLDAVVKELAEYAMPKVFGEAAN